VVHVERRLAAAAIDQALQDDLAVLLSRAYTDDRHLTSYSDDERKRWGTDVARLRDAVGRPHAGAAMPRAWLARFPTMRNLWREPSERAASWHFLAYAGAVLAGHVGVFEHEFWIDAEGPLRAAFVEDVATDPSALRSGVATRLMTAARDDARAAGAALMGLSTGIPEFYERLGWTCWQGPAEYRDARGRLWPNIGTMVLPLSTEAKAIIATHPDGRLRGGMRESE
jgi:GNAT superfamily N-acetyltransferase